MLESKNNMYRTLVVLVGALSQRSPVGTSDHRQAALCSVVQTDASSNIPGMTVQLGRQHSYVARVRRDVVWRPVRSFPATAGPFLSF